MSRSYNVKTSQIKLKKKTLPIPLVTFLEGRQVQEEVVVDGPVDGPGSHGGVEGFHQSMIGTGDVRLAEEQDEDEYHKHGWFG